MTMTATTETETVTVNRYVWCAADGEYVWDRSYDRRAAVVHLRISTGNAMAGQGNVWRYRVTIDGQELDGSWDGDARHKIQVSVPEDRT